MKKLQRINAYTKWNPPPIRETMRRFEEKTKRKCVLATKDGVCVQSQGERKIANFLYDHRIKFLYDKLVIFDYDDGWGSPMLWTRPDFILAGTNIVIEYWGMKCGRADNPTYNRRADKKKGLYYQEEMILIEVFPEHLEILEDYLKDKLIEAGYWERDVEDYVALPPIVSAEHCIV